GWRLDTIDTAGDAGKNASLALNPRTGLLGVAYNGDGAVLRYAGQNSNGTWSKSVIDGTKGAGYLSFAFDASGRATASYYSSSTADLRYGLLNKGKWSVQTVASSGTVGQYTQLSYNRTDGKA